jgi:protein-L-isoaspartate(D-aspartate) O-methyltransferase
MLRGSLLAVERIIREEWLERCGSELPIYKAHHIREEILHPRSDRRHFIPEQFHEVEYRDEPIAISENITVPSRALVELTLSLLELTPFDNVMEVGTGSGYTTAVLAKLVHEVHTLDIRPVQIGLVGKLPANVFLYKRSGVFGVPEVGQFDAILVSCAAPFPMRTWAEQLCEGGRLVMPKGDEKCQALVKYVKKDGQLRDMGDFAYVRFVPLEIELRMRPDAANR